jgi:hypothetical protein
MAYRWVTVLGAVTETSPTSLEFKGETVEYTDSTTNEKRADGGSIGQSFSDAKFNGGTIRGLIRFKSLHSRMAAGLTLAANPMTGAHLTAMLGLGSLCSVRAWNPGTSQGTAGAQSPRWIDYQLVGQQSNLKANHDYRLETTLLGSQVTVSVDGVSLITSDLRETITKFKPGVWFLSQGDVEIRDFEVQTHDPRAFIVMEFSQAYNDLYAHVIRPVCKSLSISTVRADERHGPGVILMDIERQIAESNVVIAEISPINANVFYEVGYAHALRKPTILLALRGTKLPFDISGFRTIFYDNTIDGKAHIEEGLKKHLHEVFSVSV